MKIKLQCRKLKIITTRQVVQPGKVENPSFFKFYNHIAFEILGRAIPNQSNKKKFLARLNLIYNLTISY